MALARIITLSQTCSRELALVLVARGYTVEIVSPDKVPDNFADLELRVDAGAANELVASVEAHNGESTTSLEFVHHLKAPMVDLLRRPSELRQAAHRSGESVSSNTGPVIEDRALPAGEPQLSPRTVPPAVETLQHREANPEIDSREGARLIAPQVVSPPKDPPGSFTVEDTAKPQPALIQRTIIQSTMVPRTLVPRALIDRTIVPRRMVPPTQAVQRRNPSARWPWRVGLAFASLVLLAVALGLGIRRSGKADAPGDTGQISTVPWGQTAVDSEATSSGLKQAQVAKSGTPATSPRAAVSRRHGDDLIARDTTIYFDKRFEPAPKAKKGAKPIARGRAVGKNKRYTN